MTYRIPKRRLKPRRKRPELFFVPPGDPQFLDPRSYIDKGFRVHLFGKDKELLRMQVYVRDLGYCQAKKHHFLCPRRLTYDQMHLAHRQHGPRRTDTLEETECRSAECHLIEQHNPKSVPRKVSV